MQIGDPKMDSGCLASETDIDEGYDFKVPVSAKEVIWLMDELMFREV